MGTTTGLHTATIRALPLAPLRMVCNRLTHTLVRRHPQAFVRMGAYADSRFLINPVDLPICFAFHAGGGTPALRPVRFPSPEEFDAVISGRIAALWQMARAKDDGDALFFSREITISGDTEAVLALRNTMDDMDADMLEEIFQSLGPFAAPARLAAGVAGRVHRRAMTRLDKMRNFLMAPALAENDRLRRRIDALEQQQRPRRKKAAI